MTNGSSLARMGNLHLLVKNKIKNKFDLTISGDSITKYSNPEKVMRCNPEKAIKCSNGSKFKDICDQYRHFSPNQKETDVSNIILHVRTNHLPRDDPNNVVKKTYVQLLLPSTGI